MSQPYPPPGQPYYPPPGQQYPPPGQPYYPPPSPPPPPLPPKKHRLRNALLTAALLIVVIVVFALNRGPTRTPDTKEIQEPGRLSALDLREGDCYNTTQAPPAPGTSQPISSVEAVPCTTQHTDQVIAKITYTGEKYSDVVTGGRADSDCTAQFEKNLDPAALDDASVQKGRIFPDVTGWGPVSTVACVVFNDPPISRSQLAG